MTDAFGRPLPQPEPPEADGDEDRFDPSLTQVVFGGLLVVVGVGWLLEVLDVVEFPWQAVLPAALMVVGAALVFGSRTGRHGGLVGIGVALTVLLAIGSTVDGLLDVPFRGGIGDRTVRVTSVADLESDYRLAIGQLEVDLRGVDFPARTVELEASVAIGQLVVRVPAGVATEVTAHVAIGNAIVFGDEEGGLDVDKLARSGEGDARLMLVVDVGLGQLDVRR